jgi:hypothetical protein
MNSQVTVPYIGGYGGSGSTLLERILGQIPGFLRPVNFITCGTTASGIITFADADSPLAPASSGGQSDVKLSGVLKELTWTKLLR